MSSLWWGCPVPCRTFRSILASIHLEVEAPPRLRQPKMSSNVAKTSGEGAKSLMILWSLVNHGHQHTGNSTATFWWQSFKVTHSPVCLPEHSRCAGCVPHSQGLPRLMEFSVTPLPGASLPSWTQPLRPLLGATNGQAVPDVLFILTVFIFLPVMSGKQISKTTELKRVWTKASGNRNQLQLAGIKGPQNIYVMRRRRSPAGPPSDWKWDLGSGQKPKCPLPLLLPGPPAFSSLFLPSPSASYSGAHMAFRLAPTVSKAFRFLKLKSQGRSWLAEVIFFCQTSWAAQFLWVLFLHLTIIFEIFISEVFWDWSPRCHQAFKHAKYYTNEGWSSYFRIIVYNESQNYLEFTVIITWEVWCRNKSSRLK